MTKFNGERMNGSSVIVLARMGIDQVYSDPRSTDGLYGQMARRVCGEDTSGAGSNLVLNQIALVSSLTCASSS
jgi:hypothetical protein